MAKKVIITESAFRHILTEELIRETELDKSEVKKIVKDSIKNDKEINKEIEKKVKSLVASVVNILFRTLWQRRNFYETEIQK